MPVSEATKADNEEGDDGVEGDEVEQAEDQVTYASNSAAD